MELVNGPRPGSDQTQSTRTNRTGGVCEMLAIVVVFVAMTTVFPLIGMSKGSTVTGKLEEASSSKGGKAIGSHRHARVCSRRFRAMVCAAVAQVDHSTRREATM